MYEVVHDISCYHPDAWCEDSGNCPGHGNASLYDYLVEENIIKGEN